jgi:hypothetical protein
MSARRPAQVPAQVTGGSAVTSASPASLTRVMEHYQSQTGPAR